MSLPMDGKCSYGCQGDSLLNLKGMLHPFFNQSIHQSCPPDVNDMMQKIYSNSKLVTKFFLDVYSNSGIKREKKEDDLKIKNISKNNETVGEDRVYIKRDKKEDDLKMKNLSKSSETVGEDRVFIKRDKKEDDLKMKNLSKSSETVGEDVVFNNLPKAPIFYPSEEEFLDPWGYIRHISNEVSQTGICIIQPPKSWENDIYNYIDPEKFRFHTKVQNVHQLQSRVGSNVNYIKFIQKKFKEKGENFEFPMIDEVEIDIYKLKIEIEKYDSFKNIKDNDWINIQKDLKLIPNELNVKELKKCYKKYIKPYIEEEKIYKTKNLKSKKGKEKVAVLKLNMLKRKEEKSIGKMYL